jgi:hypothetical protein
MTVLLFLGNPVREGRGSAEIAIGGLRSCTKKLQSMA